MINYKTPYFVFNEEKFKQNINQFRRALQTQWPAVIVAYSIKTNYTPGICSLVRELGCYGESVSTMELELVKKLKFPFGKSIFNGPLKSQNDMKLAIDLGSIINLDSLQQMYDFLGLPQELKNRATIGLRLNVDLGKNKIASGEKIPRFGIPYNEISIAIQTLTEENIQIQSLHGHASSSDRKPDNYSFISNYLINTAEQYKLINIKYLDVGGGFYGTVPEIWGMQDIPSYQDYADAIFRPLLASDFFKQLNPSVIIEPGMSVVADTMSYITSVVSKKTILGKNILGMDGNYFDVRPTLHQKPLPFTVVPSKNNSKDTPALKTYTLTGSTCMERDILLKDVSISANIEVGDQVIIESVGAYTNVLSPHFINYACPIYSLSENGNYKVLRNTQAFDEFFVSYNFN